MRCHGLKAFLLGAADPHRPVGVLGHTPLGGVHPQRSVVAFLSAPTVEYAVTLLGTMTAAGTCFALLSGFLPSELSDRMNESVPRLVVVSEALEDKLVKAFDVMGRTIPYVVIGRSDREVAGIYHDIVSGASLQVMEPLEMMEGYLNNDAATRQVMDGDGWSCTGDVGMVDEEGFHKITDRAKEMIKRVHGLTVSPTELDNALLEHPKVKKVCVLGILQPNTGLDSIWAYVSMCLPDDGLTEEDIKDIIRKKFNPTKHLDRVVILDDLPQTSSHKLNRRLMKEMAKAAEAVGN